MSATMVATIAPPPSLSITGSAAAASSSHCPSCGVDIPAPPPAAPTSHPDDLARIAQLEGEVRTLNDKAATAMNRWAEYEAELTRLRSSSSPPQQQQRPSPTRNSPSYLQQGTERISALLYSRKTSAMNLRGVPPALQTAVAGAADTLSPVATPTTPTAAHMTEDLLEALTREQSLRQEAEGRLSATSKEMEELSAALFEQANEMVADERRARAKLEERVGELEKRDADKKKRLDRLESAMNRIERVKKILSE
ncbi:ribosomal L32 [Cordyceps militaris]|uniref:Ribosomal L32 n=1 Tax=Cordyceps militaris TaxID=73501 RepID=A0A2H4SIY1_CORMI|nr:ribosomal L32 [Cordyceps militaris]